MAANNQSWPSWHRDLKWLFGIGFFVSLIVSLIFFVLTTLTSPENAISIATYVVAGQFSRQGLDDPGSVEELRARYANTNQQVFYPIEGLDVSITREELYSLSPRELRLKIFGQVVEPIYYQETSQESLGEYGVLAIYNQQTHEKIRRIFNLSLLPLFITGAGLVAFSHGSGRLISPAVAFLFVAPLPSLLLFLIQNTSPPPGDMGPFSAIPREVLLEIAATISPIFYGLFGAGVVLFVVGLGLKRGKRV